jgi:hypothetical protein
MPQDWVLKRTKSPGIESPQNSTKNVGTNRNPSIGVWIRSLGNQDQAQRCTRQLSMIPTNKSVPKHLRIEGTSRTRKTDENSSKRTRKIQRATNRGSTQPWKLPFIRRSDSLQIEEKSNPMEQGNEKQSGWMVCLETLELIYMSPLQTKQKDHTTPST